MPANNYANSGKRRKGKKKKRSETTAIVLIVVLVILIIIIFILAIISLGQGRSSSKRHTNVVSVADLPEAQPTANTPAADEAQTPTEAAPADTPAQPDAPADPAATEAPLPEEPTMDLLQPMTDNPDAAAPTEAPTQAAPADAHSVNYVQALSAAHVDIYSGPGSSNSITGSITDKGSYTIVEEATDASGNKWGKLKSGAGWINLTQATGGTPSAPAAGTDSTASAPAAPAPSSSRGGTSLGSSSSAAD